MNITRSAHKGKGGRKPGYTLSTEMKQRIRRSVITNNETSNIFKATHKHEAINKLHGDAFRMEFDESHGILYCDLKIIADACGVMK